jgi:hypothetical protein
MQETQSKILTETALVAELQRLGYTSVRVLLQRMGGDEKSLALTSP